MKKKRPDDTIRKRICFLFLAVLVLLSEWRYSIMKRENMLCMTESLKWNISVLCRQAAACRKKQQNFRNRADFRKESCWHLLLRVLRRLSKKMPTIDGSCSRRRSGCTVIARKQYEMLENAFCAVWDDLVCFPVKCRVSYEDSWMEERTYGGKRGHEGTDLMPPTNQREVLSGIFCPQPGRLSIWDSFKGADGGSESAVNRAVTFIMPISRNMHRGWKKGKQ